MASDVKWIKLTVDMFEDEKIDFLSSLPDGSEMILVWIRLLTMAGKCNAGGFIMLTEEVPYTDDMLAHKFRKPIALIRVALDTFRRLKMVECDETGRFYVSNWNKHQAVEGMERIREQTKKRVAEFRKKHKSLPEPESNVTNNVTERNDVTQSSNSNSISISSSSESLKYINNNNTSAVKKNGEETASPSTAVAVRAKRPVSKRVDMSDEEKALYHWVEDSFKKVPGSEALMYKDRAASARTGATIKVIVERCMNHAKGGGDPAIIARAMLETFYRAVKENEMNPKKGIEGPFIPTRLMTDWIWDKVFADCVSKSEQSDEAEIDRINRIAAETKAKMDAAKKERAYAR